MKQAEETLRHQVLLTLEATVDPCLTFVDHAIRVWLCEAAPIV